jgi:hypothetical protein
MPAVTDIPAGGLTTLGSRGDAVTVKNVTDGLIGDVVAEIAQRTRDAIISPAGVLPGQTNDQTDDLRAGSRSPWIRRDFEPSNF